MHKWNEVTKLNIAIYSFISIPTNLEVLLPTVSKLPSLFNGAVERIPNQKDSSDHNIINFENSKFIFDNYDINEPVFIRNNIHFFSNENKKLT